MRAVNYFIFAFFAVCGAVQVDNNPWKVSNPETNRWLRKGKNVATETTTPDTVTTTLNLTSTYLPKTSAKYEKKNLKFSTLTKSIMQATTSVLTSTSTPQASSKMHTFPLTSVTFPETTHSTSEASYSESTDTTETTLEPRENPKPHDFYSIKEKSREKLHVKIASNISQVNIQFSSCYLRRCLLNLITICVWDDDLRSFNPGISCLLCFRRGKKIYWAPETSLYFWIL